MRVFFILSVLLSTIVLAAPKIYDPTLEEHFDFEGKELQESKLALPEYPEKQNLIEFSLSGSQTGNYKFYLDSKSLSLGRDGINRYTVIIVSGSAQNVLYDGIRCSKAQYKNYAFASSRNFQLTGTRLWSSVGDNSLLGLRLHLFKNVICDNLHRSRKPKEIIRRLQYQ